MEEILSIIFHNFSKEEETDNKNQVEDTFRVLTNLWAHHNVIKELEELRLNPNLVSSKHIRNDLEFYIPQLW